jgi:protein-tyrosine phosphatase
MLLLPMPPPPSRSAPPHRSLDWPACLNVRDLGGLSAHHSSTPFGVFIRADDLSHLTPAGLAALRKAKVATVIDLRRVSEVNALPPHPLRHRPHYHHLPLLEDEPATFPDLDAAYDFIIRERAMHLAAIAALLAFEPVPIAFHCLHGKDRTGIVAALLLALAGVSPDAILADYTLSDTHLAPRYQALAESAQQDQLSRVLADSSCPPARMAAVLNYWRALGGPAEWLLASGLAESALAALQERLAPA